MALWVPLVTLSAAQLAELAREVNLDSPCSWDLPGFRQAIIDQLANQGKATNMNTFWQDTLKMIDANSQVVIDRIRDKLKETHTNAGIKEAKAKIACLAWCRKAIIPER